MYSWQLKLKHKSRRRNLKKLMCIALITKRKIANREQKSERVSPTKKNDTNPVNEVHYRTFLSHRIWLVNLWPFITEKKFHHPLNLLGLVWASLIQKTVVTCCMFKTFFLKLMSRERTTKHQLDFSRNSFSSYRHCLLVSLKVNTHDLLKAKWTI